MNYYLWFFDLILLKFWLNFMSAYLCVKSLKVAEYFKPRSRLLTHWFICSGWEMSTSNQTELKINKKIQKLVQFSGIALLAFPGVSCQSSHKTENTFAHISFPHLRGYNLSVFCRNTQYRSARVFILKDTSASDDWLLGLITSNS